MTLNKTSSVSLNISGNGLSASLSFSLAETSADNAHSINQRQSIATAWTAVNFGLCAPAEKVGLRNNDDTNYIQLASANDGTGIFARLKPGEGAYFPLDPATTLYAKANTAACELTVVACEL